MTLIPTMACTAQTTMRTASTSVPGMQLKPLIAVIAGLLAYNAQNANAASANAVPTAVTASSSKVAPDASFDLDMLKSRGMDVKVADFFRKAPRFTPGKRRVYLLVNGSERGSVEATFDAQGQLCFNTALLDQANLMVPASRFKLVVDKAVSATDCYDFVAAFPQTEIELRPGREEVSLVVSTDALRPLSDDYGVYQTGGTGGLFNYEVLGQNTQFSGGESRYYATNTEIGFNAGDWILRSRQSLTMQNDTRNFQSLYTYAQKTFVPIKSTLQAGQINIRNSVFPGSAITGLQVVPDAGLQGKDLGGATVEGIAQSQARVEVRQAGALIHTSLVPAGPFKLANVQVLNGFTDLDVRVIEANGQQRSFTIPAASLGNVSMSAPGYSMAVGKVRTFQDDEMDSPMVVTGSGGWLLSPSNKLSSGLMASSNDYQAMAWTLDSSLTPTSSVSFRNTVSRSGDEKITGTQASVSLSTSLSKNVTAGVNLTRQTQGFRDLLDTTRVQTDGYTDGLAKQQYGASLGWSNETLGSFSAGYSTSTSFGGQQTQGVNAAWSKNFKRATVSLNLERSLGETSYDNDYLNLGGSSTSSNINNGTAMYLSVSVPLGNNRSVRSYANKRNGNTRFGVTMDDSSNDLATYTINSERDTLNKEQDFSGNVNMLPRYTQVNVGYAQNGSDSTSYTGQVRGGVAVHDQGVTFSPYQLADTFGVAKVGKVSGVKLNTPSGPVWTDKQGNAVIPQLNAYQNTRVEVETKSLPRNVDIKNGFKSVSAGRGAVSKLDFPVEVSRRALLQITDANGQLAAKGNSVLDSKGDFVTAVVEDGNVFLSNGQLNESLSISLGGGKSCAIHYQLPDVADLKVYFETASAICTPN
ncbi:MULTISPECIES: fimbrial biogenesis usher protein [unclassified Pseudomonas]|uniref:fimbrial biogenesis usher protein n=1 Tax=unclassified Pseudomonas TaxID=196821 RepID=UPI002AC89A90|nr:MULTISPECIES: fimbrial biogenesis usher protein [unclassified Pseudomonas]MEB0047316.1 fimbrial biogenesis usher protein [Pseudomonas sp. Dout3]MEB0096568.1 fimbrial biogenesis usher protein [Pseudomonas sp. DC1.2]WPX60311.1 fimbrial biogenesis usher protein [Pseudomonas sp. DC1.2]